ncbi:MAG TPA: hypothetical protein VLE53_12725 [Gemmatimonadaceae bacterium]|nr:hypothetical protein [Gemmatimonadaceae bacterium]
MKRIALILACTAVATALPAGAQTAGQQAAYEALIYTPVAGFAPLPPSLSMTPSRGTTGISLQGRIGKFSREGGLTATSLGIGVEMPVQRWSLTGTVAYLSVSCGPAWEGASDCNGDILIGGNARTTLTKRPLGEAPPPAKGTRRPAAPSNGGTLVVGFDGSLGFSPRAGHQAIALAASLPTGIALESGTVKIMPFLSPGLGFGRLGSVEFEDDEAPRAYGSIMFMIGGGLGLEFGRSGLGANVGFQKVLKSNGGATALGLGMTWHGLSAAR